MRSINICKIHKTTSIERNYNIINYPYFLFFLLEIDFETYKEHINQIFKIFGNNLKIKNIDYILKGIIFMPSHKYFTCAVNNIKEKILEIGIGKNIYHDGMIK